MLTKYSETLFVPFHTNLTHYYVFHRWVQSALCSNSFSIVRAEVSSCFFVFLFLSLCRNHVLFASYMLQLTKWVVAASYMTYTTMLNVLILCYCSLHSRLIGPVSNVLS